MIKQNFLRHISQLFIIFTAIFLLAACSSSSNNSASATEPVIETGFFIDSPVSGITFETDTQSGQTNVEGEFLYIAGETITFKLGGIILGSAPAKEKMTPLDMVDGSNATNNLYILNMARLLQTLDDDGNPDNGIVLSPAVIAATDSININFADLNQFALESNPEISELLITLGISDLIAIDVAVDNLEASLIVESIVFNDLPVLELCADTICGTGEACYSGSCFYTSDILTDACTDVICGVSQICYAGACYEDGTILTDACTDVICGVDQICYAGACYEDGTILTEACTDVICGVDQICYAGACSTAQTLEDACIGVSCNASQSCYVGNCYDACPANAPPELCSDPTTITGTLNTSFDSDGLVVHNAAADSSVTTSNDGALAITLDASDNVYVTGYSYNGYDDDMVIWKYTSSGTLDTTFSSDGIAVSDVGIERGQAIALDAAGNIYVTGSINTGDLDIALWKYNIDGTLDSSFGNSGIVVYNGGFDRDQGNAISIDRTGNIYITGYVSTDSSIKKTDMIILKFDSDGNLSTTFGTDGVVTHDAAGGESNSFDYGHSMILDSTGSLYVVGESSNATSREMAIWKYSTDGVPDTSFASDGFLSIGNAAGGDSTDLGLSIALDTTGNIYVAGYSDNSSGNTEMIIWKFTSNGVLDTTFDGDGIVQNIGAAGSDAGDRAYAITIDSTDNIFVVGQGESGSDLDMLIWKYTSNGVLDTSFGVVVHNGAAGGSGTDFARAVVLDSKGNIFVAGGSDNISNNRDMVIWSYK